MYALAYWKGNSLHLRGRLQHIYVRALAYGKNERQFCTRRPASARGHAPAEFASLGVRIMQGQARGTARVRAWRRCALRARLLPRGSEGSWKCCKMEEAMATSKQKLSPCRDEILLPPPTSPTRLSTPKNRDHDTGDTASVCSVKTTSPPGTCTGA